MPICWIIAGPNGAGKTTFALNYLPEVVKCTHFINADLIAAGLSPLAPERELVAASRIFLQELESCIKAKQDFAFETTLSGKSYLRWVRRLKAEGWCVELIYLALPSIEMSKMRVAERVKQGGHNIPVDAIERRFARSLFNMLELFSFEVDHCQCYMSIDKVPSQVFEQFGATRNIIDSKAYEFLLKEAQNGNR